MENVQVFIKMTDEEAKRLKSNSPQDLHDNSDTVSEDFNYFDNLVDNNSYSDDEEENSICEEEEEEDDEVICIDEHICLPLLTEKKRWSKKCHYKDCKVVSKKLKMIPPVVKHSPTSLIRTYEH